MARPSSSRDLSHLASVVIAVTVIAALYFARVVLLPLALAILFTFVLTPLVRLLERMHFGRVVSVLLVVLLSVAAVSAVGWTVTQQFGDVMNQLPGYRTNIEKKLEPFRLSRNRTLNNASDTMSQISKDLAGPPAPAQPGQLNSRQSSGAASGANQHPVAVEIVKSPSLPLESLQSVLGILASFGIVVVLTIFILISREDLRNRFISLAGQGRLNTMTQALDEAGERISRYLRLQLAVNGCYGLFIGLGLHFIGVPGALLFGVIVGILRFLPYIGPPLGAIMPLLLSFAVFDGSTRPLITLALFVITELVVSNLIEPALYGTRTGISSVAILIAAIFWTALWGPAGLVLSTPLTVCLVVMGRHVPRLHFLQILLGDEPVLAPESRFYQRLLAMDHNEAKIVLEGCLKEQQVEDLYDSVLIPALSLAEQDRHRNNLDKATQNFIHQSTRELIEELAERITGRDLGASAIARPNAAIRSPQIDPSIRVVCVPARDEADEIVATMLTQLLQAAGHHAECLPVGPTSETISWISRNKPDAVCISALPPFALSHAKSIYSRLRDQFPQMRIMVGLWNYAGDATRVSKSIGVVEQGGVATTLSQMVTQFRTPVPIEPAVVAD